MMFYSRLVSDAVRHFTGNDCSATAYGHDDVIDHVISTSLRHSLVFIARGIFVIFSLLEFAIIIIIIIFDFRKIRWQGS